jgi:hypothetical protein
VSRTAEAARIERMFLFAFVPAAIFIAACLYVRVTSNPDPLWSEFGTPLFLSLVGLRAMVIPTAPESRKASRAVGALLIVLSAIVLFLAIRNSQGA